MAGTRVLKAHLDAIRSLLPVLTDEQIFEVAESVLTAEDGKKTRYCVGTRAPSGSTVIYGPYATHAAALRAVELGAVGTGIENLAGVFPLVPAPKRPPRLKEVESIHRDRNGFAVTPKRGGGK